MTDSGLAVADLRGPAWYLWWLVRRQKRRVALGALFGSAWMVGLTLPPYLLSQAVDHGLERRDPPVLAGWVAVLFAVGAANAALAILRHRTMTQIRMDAAYRTVRAVLAHATRLGAALPRRAGTGEAVTVGMTDAWVLAQALTATGPGLGAVLAYVVAAALMFEISPPLAVVVLAGMPVLALVMGPMLRRLQRAGLRYRERQGVLAEHLLDIVGGLRVLNGLGGKDVFAGRFHRESRALAAEGYRVGAVTSWIQALGVGLPALFLAVVTWLAARMAAAGSISAGELVAVFGYAAMLSVPVAFFIEGGFDLGHALVAGRRVVAFLRLPADPRGELPAPAGPAELWDPESGVVVPPGRFVALATARMADAAAVVDRLGGPDGTPPGPFADVTRSDAAFRAFLHGLPGVDQVGAENRVKVLGTRSIKTTAKAWAIDTAISMVDLTTLEGSDTPGKVRSLAAKARRPDPEDPGCPPVAAVCVYGDLAGVAKEALAGTGIKVAAVATAWSAYWAAIYGGDAIAGYAQVRVGATPAGATDFSPLPGEDGPPLLLPPVLSPEVPAVIDQHPPLALEARRLVADRPPAFQGGAPDFFHAARINPENMNIK